MSEPTRDPQAEPNAKDRKRAVVVMPRVDERTTGGAVVSFLIHATAILLLFLPAFNQKMLQINMEGAGGAGPAGGGGGGHRGTGGVREEQVQYMSAAPTPVSIPKIIPPVVEEKKKEPEVVPPPVVAPPAPTTADTAAKVTSEVTAPVVGTGGGTGNDGTSGSGPGRGGGRGSGVGDGVGSSVGSGTGGGSGTKYKASVTTLVILPIPVPARVKPYSMEACFEVDSLGRQRLLTWTKSKDDSYNRKVEESLKGYRFRPAVLPSGVAVRDTSCIKAVGG